MSKEENYNGWTNRETWLFNLWYGDYIDCEADYWVQKSCFSHDYYEACVKLGNNIFNDMLDINLINWDELLITYKNN
tara:strand:- start:606 stop:836 length:231 start_codon:yes stop_codon:yes gene_type:complete